MTPALLDASLLTSAEAAELLRVSAKTLSSWRSRQSGPPWLKLSNGIVRYRVSDITEFVADRVVSPERTVSA